MVIDIQPSLSRGIRGSEPTHTPTPQDCIHSCCATRNILGDKACNLMIFDTRKTTNQPNCYLFFCPSEDACPLKPAKGLRSYRIITEPPPSSAGAELSSPGQWYEAAPSLPPTPRGSSKPADVLRGDVWSQESGSPGHSEKLLRIGPTSPWLLRSDGDAHSPSSHFSSEQQDASPGPEHGTTVSTPAASATRHRAAPGTPAVQSQVVTTAGRVTAAPPRPSTGLLATVGTGAVTSPPASLATTPMTLRTGTTARLKASSPATASSRGASSTMPLAEASDLVSNIGAHEAATLPPSSLDSAPGNKTSSQETGHRLSAASLESVPDRRRGLLFEKWLLVGSLVFGVLFLAVSLILMGRMFLESLHRKRYSRLDYLINGIYVDI